MPASSIHIFLAGALGGALPSLIRVGLAYAQPVGSERADFDLLYVVGTLIMGAVGAGVAWGFEETNRKKAVMLGVSLPAFLQLGAADLKKQLQNQVTLASLSEAALAMIALPFGTTAFAQSAPAGPAVGTAPLPGRTIELSTGDKAQSYAAIFKNASGKELVRYAVEDKKFLSTQIPDDAICVVFEAGGKQSASFDLGKTPGAATAFEINLEQRKKLGLWAALGIDQGTQTTITATKNEIVPPAIGTEGWVYLGKRSGNSWQTVYAKFLEGQGQGIPQAGTTASVTFTLRLRQGPGTENPSIGTLPTGHLFTILETRTNDNTTYWARIKTGS